MKRRERRSFTDDYKVSIIRLAAHSPINVQRRNARIMMGQSDEPL
jgi:hypothetical protein